MRTYISLKIIDVIAFPYPTPSYIMLVKSAMAIGENQVQEKQLTFNNILPVTYLLWIDTVRESPAEIVNQTEWCRIMGMDTNI